ncbi:MAG: hypothetical protein IKO90_02870 [Bacteroidales bacterium]|nr:hypothetical protein [Bacteroidales bacterium]MBP5723322.1 hypothetical protein [Bacteroidales bacterium]MBQ3677716.1 hypothetical protein [Bacteroidales bacterium]MBR4689387.1 hypothetical protein [Bacteroidales bacterium]MBR7036225.1 hypothetical protein [Bacteroidales bacterium]
MRSNTLKLFRLLIVLGLLSGIVSCSNSDKKNSSSTEDVVDQELQEKQQVVNDVKKVMYSLPSPVETTLLLKKAGAGYDESLLNPTSNSNKYNTDKQKALNLGVYGADLSYASIFEQDQTIMQYMNVSKKLAIGLDLLAAIDQSIIDRLEANHDNRDSVIRIISETFLNSNSTLKEDNRPEMAALILAGGWVEALYLATQLTKDVVKDKDLVERIVEQKLSFGEMEKLLGVYTDNPDIAEVLTQLQPISQAFNAIEIVKSGIETITDEETGSTVLKSTQKINITQAQYEALKLAAANLRNSFIQ